MERNDLVSNSDRPRMASARLHQRAEFMSRLKQLPVFLKIGRDYTVEQVSLGLECPHCGHTYQVGDSLFCPHPNLRTRHGPETGTA